MAHPHKFALALKGSDLSPFALTGRSPWARTPFAADRDLDGDRTPEVLWSGCQFWAERPNGARWLETQFRCSC